MFWNKCTNINLFLSAFKLKQFLKSIINFSLNLNTAKTKQDVALTDWKQSIQKQYKIFITEWSKGKKYNNFHKLWDTFKHRVF